REGKMTCWEGGTRTPCIMRWPGVIPSRSVNDKMLMSIDLFPTVAKYIGAELPRHKIDGLDILPVLKNEKSAANPHAAYFFWYDDNHLESVISGDGRWKLQLPHSYRTLNGRSGGKDGKPAAYEMAKVVEAELYDLQSDIGERKDVAKQYPEMM